MSALWAFGVLAGLVALWGIGSLLSLLVADWRDPASTPHHDLCTCGRPGCFPKASAK